jgi:hypothetical protein
MVFAASNCFAQSDTVRPVNFAPPVNYDSRGFRPSSIVVADVNADGKPDMVVGHNDRFNNTNGTVSVLLGNGDGTFQTALTYDSSGVVSVAVADLNGDAKPDIVVANEFPYPNMPVGVLLGNGDGTFQTIVTYGSGGIRAFRLSVTDVNGDGKPDVVIANKCDHACNNGTVGILLGNGDGTLQTAVVYQSGDFFAFSVAVADVNNDGRRDIMVANFGRSSEGSVSVLLSNGNGTFQTAVPYRSGGYEANSVVVDDVNGDGKPDILVANDLYISIYAHNLGVLLGNGDGTFQTAVTYGTGGGFAVGLSVGDLNGDGKPDVVVPNSWSNTAGVLLGNGDGSFQSALTYSSGGQGPTSVAVADVNGDGKPDVLLTNECDAFCFTGTVGVLINITDMAPPLITLSPTPNSLWPPNGKMVQVTVSGTITDKVSGVNTSSAVYEVRDEYGIVLPRGAITLGSGGAYSFNVGLQASRLGTDLNGRRYTVRVIAKDNAGNRASKTGVVIVPHDTALKPLVLGEYSP